MAKIAEGYAETAKAAIMFNEPDTGAEVFPFENAAHCREIATMMMSDYGVDTYIDFDVEDYDGAFCGSVPEAVSQKLLTSGDVTSDIMWDFDPIMLTRGECWTSTRD